MTSLTRNPDNEAGTFIGGGVGLELEMDNIKEAYAKNLDVQMNNLDITFSVGQRKPVGGGGSHFNPSGISQSGGLTYAQYSAANLSVGNLFNSEKINFSLNGSFQNRLSDGPSLGAAFNLGRVNSENIFFDISLQGKPFNPNRSMDLMYKFKYSAPFKLDRNVINDGLSIGLSGGGSL